MLATIERGGFCQTGNRVLCGSIADRKGSGRVGREGAVIDDPSYPRVRVETGD